MFNTKKKSKVNVVESLIQQHEDNAFIIGDLLRRQRELLAGTGIMMDASLFDIVVNQQKTIRDLQQSIMQLENECSVKNEP